MTLLLAQRLLWNAGLISELLLVRAIFHRRLAKSYPFFLAYLIFQATASIVLMQIEYKTVGYAEAFRWYEGAMIVLRAGVALELFERFFGHFPGFGKLRFWIGAVLLALAGMVGWGVFEPLTPNVSYPHTLVLILTRWETSAVVLALVLMRCFLGRFVGTQPPIRANVESHWRLTIAYFSISAIGAAGAILDGSETVRLIEDLIVYVLQIACIIGWIVLFRRAGELVPARVSEYTPEESEAIGRRERWMHALVTKLPDEVARSMRN